MRVLVTGATGFVGGWLTRELSKDHHVKVLRRKSSDTSAIDDLPIEHCLGDVTDPESLNQAVSGVDAVFHLAGLVAYSPKERPIMEQVNVRGTANVVDACIKSDIPRLIHMSSVVAVGASFDGQPLNENSEFNVGHLDLGYFETKRKAETLVKTAADQGKLDAVILNPSTIYGAGDAKKGSRKTQLKVSQGRFHIYPPGGVNVVAIEDVVAGLLAAWQRGQAGRRYILAGENISIKDLFKQIALASGVQSPKYPLSRSAIHFLGWSGDLLTKVGLKGPLNRESAWTAVLYHWFENERARNELELTFRPATVAIENSVSWIKENHDMLSL